MAIHERQAIRDAAVAQLIGPPPYARTAAGARVFKTRNGPVREADLPCLCVFTANETVKDTQIQESFREVTLTVEGYVKAAPTADLDAAMDALALQVETTWELDIYLAGTVCTSELTRTTLETSMLGAQPMGRIALDYVCTYEAPCRAPAPTDAFITADIRTSLSGAQALDDQSHDVVTLP